ncbi:MAG: adenylate/guanylate cyclase domain-containing protein [Stappiaceae bacterium]
MNQADVTAPVPRRASPVAYAILVLTATCIGMLTVFLARQTALEGWIFDRLMQVSTVLGKSQNTNRFPVLVVRLDAAALESPQMQTVPRTFLTPIFAKAAEGVLDAGAKAVGFDFVFVFSADDFTDPGSGRQFLKGYETPFLRFLHKNRGKVLLSRTTTSEPHRRLAAAAGPQAIKYTRVLPDSDGVVRRHQFQLDGNAPSDFVEAALIMSGQTAPEVFLPLHSTRAAERVPSISLHTLLDMLKSNEGRKQLSALAKDRVVLFGGALTDEDQHVFSDRFLPAGDVQGPDAFDAEPFYKNGKIPGVFLLASLIGSPLTGDYAVPVSWLRALSVILLFSGLGALCGGLIKPGLLPVVAILLLGGGLLVVYGALEFGLAIPAADPAIASMSALVVGVIGRAALLGRRERRLARLYGHYLSPEVIKNMAESEDLPALGGDTRHVVVAFIDIAGYTKISEQRTDEEMVDIVNRCFDRLGQIIMESGGFIDKYIGDAIMVLWNAPNKVDDPEMRAVDAGCNIIAALPELRKISGVEEVDLRVVIHAGPALVGHVGGEARRSFTAIGTTVNISSRIEGIAKEKNVRLAFSDAVAEKLAPEKDVEKIWSGQLRGLQRETAVYTLAIEQDRSETS